MSGRPGSPSGSQVSRDCALERGLARADSAKVFLAGECRRAQLEVGAEARPDLDEGNTDTIRRRRPTSGAARQDSEQRSVVRGKVLLRPGTDSPLPLSAQAGGVAKSAQVCELSQEWHIAREPERGKALAYFYPFDYAADQHEVDPALEARLHPTSLATAIDHLERGPSSPRSARSREPNEDAQLIEQTIFEVSEFLAHRGPVSRAQAEASEELLRSRIAEAILNLQPSTAFADPPERVSALDPAIKVLGQRLHSLKETLIQGETKIIHDELAAINSLRNELTCDDVTLFARQHRVRQRFDAVARMTPLIHMVRSKVSGLDRTVRINQERQEYERLLKAINKEINEIHRLCKNNRDIESVNKVINVLTRVCSIIDRMMEEWNEGVRAPHLAQPTSPNGVQAPSQPALLNHVEANAHANFYRKQVELITNATVRVQETAKAEKLLRSSGRDDRDRTPRAAVEVSLQQKPVQPSSTQRFPASEVFTETSVTARRRAQHRDVQAVFLHSQAHGQFLFDDAASVPGTQPWELERTSDDETSGSVPLLFSRRPPRQETAIVSDDDELHVTNVVNECAETFKLKKKRRNYRVNALIYPAVSGRFGVTVTPLEYLVDVSPEPEAWKNSAVVLTGPFAAETFVYKVGEEERDESSDEETLTSAPLQQLPGRAAAARIGREKGLLFDDFNECHNSFFHVTVTENDGEARSRSMCSSIRSSMKSLALSEHTLISQQSFEVPTYVIKPGSTASITCELNTFVHPTSLIEWFCGRAHINQFGGKYIRMKDKFMEVLVINGVEAGDSELYSITVDDEIYPVAYLIIESQENARTVFTTPAQTMFVMERQAAVMSCQTVQPDMPVQWFHEGHALRPSARVHFQSDGAGWHRVLIDEVVQEDQGVYFAQAGGHSASVTLVVEGNVQAGGSSAFRAHRRARGAGEQRGDRGRGPERLPGAARLHRHHRLRAGEPGPVALPGVEQGRPAHPVPGQQQVRARGERSQALPDHPCDGAGRLRRVQRADQRSRLQGGTDYCLRGSAGSAVQQIETHLLLLLVHMIMHGSHRHRLALT